MRIRNPFRKRDVRDLKDPFAVQGRLLNSAAALTIFDVGAYVGDIALTYRRVFPQASIHCFEPFPASFARLKQSCQEPSIRLNHVALSNQKGTATLHVNADASCNSTLPPNTKGQNHHGRAFRIIGEIEVPTITLDAFCDQTQIERIDILKIDVEGAEISVLEGAAQRLADQRIDLIYTEVMFTPHYEGGCVFHDISACLAGYGYTLFNLYQFRTARNGQLRWGNAIFLSPSRRAKVERD